MATIHRLDYPGAIHHAYVRGNDRRDIFLDETDRAFFLGRLAKLKREMKFKLYAFCLMTNHFHLLIETASQPLSKVMGRLLSVYAARFHDRNGGVGHLFQGPYGAKLCARDSYFVRLVRYIHRNPVQAGLCVDPAEWEWSGQRQLKLGQAGLLDEDLPLSFFGGATTEGREAYAKFSEDGGDDTSLEFVAERPSLGASLGLLDVVQQIAEEFGISTNQLLSGSRQRTLTAAKVELARRAELYGHLQIEVARILRCTNSALTQLRARNN